MANEKRLIDANALKDMLRTNEGAKALGHSVHRLFCVDDIIDAQPNVDAVEVVHAHWEMGVDEGDYEYGTCSVCGYNEYNAFCCLLPHNYCPNCGAKMDGGNEDGV